MVDIATIVDSVYPSDGANGVVLTDTIRIIFDRELDESSLKTAVFVEGEDTDEVIHNSYIPTTLIEGRETSLLESPAYGGLVQGTFEFFRISLTSEDVVDIDDTTGDGGLYRTKLVFTPDEPFSPDTVYKLYIAGDDDLTDDEDFGLRSRSVFDVVADGGNTSTGGPVLDGSYSGSPSSDTVNLRVSASGILATAEYDWWLDSYPIDLQGPSLTHINTLALANGVNIRFTEGLYVEGDIWTVSLKRAAFYEGQIQATFTTGGGVIVPLPGEAATSPVGDPLPSSFTTTLSAGTLSIIKTSPADLDGNVSPGDYRQIEVEFNQALDPASITADMVRVTAEPVIDHPCLDVVSPNGEIARAITVSGNKLIIDI